MLSVICQPLADASFSSVSVLVVSVCVSLTVIFCSTGSLVITLAIVFLLYSSPCESQLTAVLVDIDMESNTWTNASLGF